MQVIRGEHGDTSSCVGHKANIQPHRKYQSSAVGIPLAHLFRSRSQEVRNTPGNRLEGYFLKSTDQSQKGVKVLKCW